MLAITGSTGFVGSYFVDQLSFPQIRLVRKSSFVHKSSDSISYVHGNLENISDRNLLIKDASTLIHLACSNHPRTSNRIENDIQQNLTNTIQLFEEFAKINPHGHIIFVSTGGNMYAADVSGLVRTEDDLPSPLTSYSICKFASEQYLRSLCRLYGIRATVLRLANPYGTLLSTKRTQGLIGVAFSKLLLNETFSIIDSLDSVRDYIHLEDVKNVFQVVLEKPPSLGEFRLFNVSSGMGYSLSEVLTFIENVSGKEIKKEFLSQSKPTWSVLSYKRLEATLGWTPTISLHEGLKQMWDSLSTDR